MISDVTNEKDHIALINELFAESGFGTGLNACKF